MVSLELAHIQGNILRSYNFPSAVHIFFRVDDPHRGREFLTAIARHVTTARKWKKRARPAIALNVALTYRGLERLEVGREVLAALPREFAEPITERARRVLDDDIAAWEGPFTGDDLHVLVIVSARDPAAPSVPSALHDWARATGADPAGVGLPVEMPTAHRGPRFGDDELEHVVRALAAVAATHGLVITHAQAAEATKSQREHFGWADGFGQPAVEGLENNLAGQGIPIEGGLGWRSLKPGEFVHGYVDEDGQLTSGPAAALLRNGSFMVYRKLEQHVDRFRAQLEAESERFRTWTGRPLGDAQARELLAAKLAGRWRDGVALELRPERSEAECRDLVSKSAKQPVDNNFRYADDRDGFRCPVGAHIRRTNPRDAEGRGGPMATRHRIIRRGMPYGRPYDDAPDEGRGLIFIGFNADIARQFETIQAQWCNDGNAFGLGEDRDWMLHDGGGTRKATVHGVPPFFVQAREPVVTARGCAYLLMPGIDALEDIGDGAWS